MMLSNNTNNVREVYDTVCGESQIVPEALQGRDNSEGLRNRLALDQFPSSSVVEIRKFNQTLLLPLSGPGDLAGCDIVREKILFENRILGTTWGFKSVWKCFDHFCARRREVLTNPRKEQFLAFRYDYEEK